MHAAESRAAECSWWILQPAVAASINKSFIMLLHNAVKPRARLGVISNIHS